MLPTNLKSLLTAIVFLLLPLLAIAQDTTSYVYASVQGSNIISVFSINRTNGSLTKVYDQAVSGGPMSIAVSPNKKFMYVSQRTAMTFSSYSIDKTTGRLTLLGTIPALDNPVNISTDKTGQFLLSAYYAANKAAVYKIDTVTGLLIAGALSSFSTAGINPHCIKTDPSNKFVFLTNMTGNRIQQFTFNPTTGALTPNSPALITPVDSIGPRHFVFSGNKDLVYFTNEIGNKVTVFSLNTTTGLLTLLQEVSSLPVGYVQTMGVDKVADIHMTPDNKFLYVSNRGSNTIAAFNVDATTGLLSSIGYYPTQTSPRGFDLDLSGSYLYAAGETSGKMSYYKINKTTGALDSIAAYTLGTNPTWIMSLSFITPPAITCINLVTIPIVGLASAGIYTMVLFDAAGTTQLKVLANGSFKAGDSNFLFSKVGFSAGSYTYKLMNGATVVKSGTVIIT